MPSLCIATLDRDTGRGRIHHRDQEWRVTTVAHPSPLRHVSQVKNRSTWNEAMK